MKILIRNHKHEKWQLVQSAAYAGETELQHLLAEEPSLISIDEVRAGAGTLVVAVREFPLDIGFIDLVGFTADGDIAVVECKLAASEEIKRKVIGQVFEYGANLWGITYETLDQKINARTKKSLADLVRDALQDQTWDEEAFRTNIEAALQIGNFVLIIVVDEIQEDLNRIVRFINDAGHPAFSLAALEMPRFQHGEAEMLVPHIFGSTKVIEPPGHVSGRKNWNTESYLADAKNKLQPEALKLIEDLFEWTKKNGDDARFGTGKATGSYTFYYNREGKFGSVFSIYTDGTLTFNFGYMEKIFTKEQIQDFRLGLSKIPTLKGVKDAISFYNIALEKAFTKIEFVDEFKDEVLNLKKSL